MLSSFRLPIAVPVLMIAFNSTSGTYKLTYQETPKPLNDEPGTQRGARLVKQMVSTENLLRRPIDDTPENVDVLGPGSVFI